MADDETGIDLIEPDDNDVIAEDVGTFVIETDILVCVVFSFGSKEVPFTVENSSKEVGRVDFDEVKFFTDEYGEVVDTVNKVPCCMLALDDNDMVGGFAAVDSCVGIKVVARVVEESMFVELWLGNGVNVDLVVNIELVDSVITNEVLGTFDVETID